MVSRFVAPFLVVGTGFVVQVRTYVAGSSPLGFTLTLFPSNDMHVFCLKVQGQGDRNGLDVAQVVHENMLSSGGVLRLDNLMRYGTPVPKRRLWLGIYVDDWLCTCKKRFHLLRRPLASDPDVKLSNATSARYLELDGVDESKEKHRINLLITSAGVHALNASEVSPQHLLISVSTLLLLSFFKLLLEKPQRNLWNA